MKRRIIYMQLLCLTWTVLISGCQSAVQNGKAEKRHWAEVDHPALGLLYVDETEAGRVMKVPDSSGTNFIAYKIGIRDEQISADNKYKQERGKYLQYNLPRDWSLKAQADSFAPVFFQPLVKTVVQEDEGILVFEIPAGIKPDTLIYHDSFGGWGIQKIILNSH